MQSLFLFNPKLKPTWENPKEEDYTLCKLIYYYPQDASQYEKQTHVGLAEGLMQFASNFSENILETIETERFEHILFECEPDIWINIVFQKPTPLQIKSIPFTYYQHFKLFYGSLSNYQIPDDLQYLNEKFNEFTPIFFHDISPIPYMGLQYCPLDKKAYMKVQYLQNCLLNQFEIIKHCMVTYEGQLVCSTLNQQQTLLLYQYFCNNSNYRRLEILQQTFQPHQGQYANIIQYPQKGMLYYVTDEQATNIYLDDQIFHLVTWVENSLQIILCLQQNTYQIWDTYQSDLEQLSQDLIETVSPQYRRALMQEDNYKFIYYNKINLAIRQSSRLLEPNFLSIINKISWQMQQGLTKCFLKEGNNWIIGINVLDQRDIFVVIPNSTSVASKIEEEASKFISHYFHNIFTNI